MSEKTLVMAGGRDKIRLNADLRSRNMPVRSAGAIRRELGALRRCLLDAQRNRRQFEYLLGLCVGLTWVVRSGVTSPTGGFLPCIRARARQSKRTKRVENGGTHK